MKERMSGLSPFERGDIQSSAESDSDAIEYTQSDLDNSVGRENLRKFFNLKSKAHNVGSLARHFSFWVFTALLTINLLVVATGLVRWAETPLGGLQGAIINTWRSGNAVQVEESDDGSKVYVLDSQKVGVMDDGRKFAPRPSTEFRDKKCDMKPLNEIKSMDESSLAIPSIGKDIVHVLPTQDATVLPDAPDGITYKPGASLNDKSGAVIMAGHVDFRPGILSEKGGELSPVFGKMHTMLSCDHIYTSTDTGEIQEYVLVSMYLENQDDVQDVKEYFRKTGDKTLYLFTCSGKSIESAGGSFQFNYQDNLVLKAIPVS